ncbi:MAG: hypothetical protein V4469_02555 [Patescibacteria group bacterium]
MKFTLPTQHAPNKEVTINGLTISPATRVKIEVGFGTMYWDSMNIEFSECSQNTINEWVIFHNIIFNDYISLEWYESTNFDTDKMIPEGECNYLLDYSDISNKIYFPNNYPHILRYADLYKKYLDQSRENKSLIKAYFNSKENTRITTERTIRNSSFLRILVLFSITESIIGTAPKCPGIVECSVHGKIHSHSKTTSKEWIEHRLSEIIKDTERVEEYLKVIWEIRQKIRHKTVHEALIPKSSNIIQDEGEIVWDWSRTSEEWRENSVALLSLMLKMDEITRNLLLNKIFNLNLFPELKPLRSKRVVK